VRTQSAGFSLIELLVILGIVGILVAMALPKSNRGALSLVSSLTEFEANVRIARGNSTGRGIHYRITLYADYYEIDRLKLSGGAWVHDPLYSVQTVTLPSRVTVTTGAGQSFEFNSRGLLYSATPGIPATQVNVVLKDTQTNETKSVGIWPSGQIIGS
jgi:hypothetical protein